MEEIYLKEVKEEDIDILSTYNNMLAKRQMNGWVSEDRFVNLLKEWKNDIDDELKIHFFPFWLMKDKDVIGLVILKDNIDVDEVWKNYGGNISYVIIPDYRRKGYGTKALNLAIKKCKELGINNILITCLDSNIGSIKIIEKNKGVLKDTCTDNSNGELTRRYIINIDV